MTVHTGDLSFGTKQRQAFLRITGEVVLQSRCTRVVTKVTGER